MTACKRLLLCSGIAALNLTKRDTELQLLIFSEDAGSGKKAGDDSRAGARALVPKGTRGSGLAGVGACTAGEGCCTAGGGRVTGAGAGGRTAGGGETTDSAAAGPEAGGSPVMCTAKLNADSNNVVLKIRAYHSA